MEFGNGIGVFGTRYRRLSAEPVAPTANGLLPDLMMETGIALDPTDLSGDFFGPGLTFALAPGSSALPSGLSLSTSGVLTGTPVSQTGPLTIILRGTNGDGFVDSAFLLSVVDMLLTFSASLSGLTNNPTHGPAAQNGVPLTASPASFSGTAPSSVSYQWKTVESGAIPGATAATYTPDAGLFDGEALYCTISAAPYFDTDTPLAVIRQIPPTAAGMLMDEVFDQDTGPQDILTAMDFTGVALTFSVTGGDAVIDNVTGVISLPTNAERAGEAIVVSASNSGGAVESKFLVTVEPPFEADVVTSFGALTRAGAGGVDIGDSAIASGNAAGHWQISGGAIAPSSAGQGNLSGIYDLTLSDGQTVRIATQDGTYSVASAAELLAAWTDAPASATGIQLRDGDYSAGPRVTLPSKVFTTTFTIEPATEFVPALTPKTHVYSVTLPGLMIGNATRNLRLYGLAFYETLNDVITEQNGVIEIEGGGTAANITIEDCQISSRNFVEAFDSGVFADGPGFSAYPNQSTFFSSLNAIRGVRLDEVQNARVLGCHIHDVTRGIVMGSVGIENGNRSRIQGCWIEDVVSNFTTAGGATDGLDIWDNRAMHAWGSDGEVPSNPLHSAVGLSFDNSAGTPFQNVTVKGNLFHVGWTRKRHTIDSGRSYTVVNAATGMKFNDPQQTYAYRNITVAHNLVVSHGLCLEFSGAQDIDIYNNTLSSETYAAPDATVPSVYFQGAENVRLWNNIAPIYTLGVNDGGSENGSPMVVTAETAQQYGNLAAAGNEGDLGFSALFNGIAGGFNFLTLDQLEAAYTPKPTSFALTAAERKGALGTGYYAGNGVDTAPAFTARTASGAVQPPTTTLWNGAPYLTSGALAGAIDGRGVTLAWQGEIDPAQDGNGSYFIQANGLRVAARFLGGGRIRFYIESPAGLILQGDTPDIPINSTTGRCAWAFSADLTTGQACFALNGKPLPLPLGLTGATTLTDIDWTTSVWAINAQTSGADPMTCEFDAVLISNRFIDLDTNAGLSKLFAADGLFKDWGAGGANINGSTELVVIQGANAAQLNGGSANTGAGGVFSMNGGSVTDKAGAGPADLLAEVGDFTEGADWSLESGLTITAGVLDINTTSNFASASLIGGNRVACAPGQTLGLEYTMSVLSSATRLRIGLRAYDAAGVALESLSYLYDTNADGATVIGLNTKPALYTTPANAASLEVVIDVVLSGFVGQMDNCKLLVS